MITQLGTVISEYSVRNKRDEDIPVYSVTNEHGFCTGYFSKDVASKDRTTYKIVPHGCFAYNPSRINVGSIDWQHCENRVIVSPLYVVFKVDESAIDQQYLLYYLKSDIALNLIKAKANGSVRDNLRLSDLQQFTLNLPDLPTQRRIASTLDAITALIAKRHQQLDALDQLVKSRFVEMFGEDGRKGHCVIKTLQELLDVGWIKYHLDGNHGSDYPRANEFVDVGIPYISANCIINDQIDMSLAKHVTSERAKRFRKGIAKCGDVLFAHNATVGPVALLVTDEPLVILGTSLTSYRCNTDYILPEYLMAFMKNPFFVRQYEKDMQQSTRKQVPITTQRKYSFVIPAANEQKTFAEFVRQADKSKFIIRQSLQSLETLKKSLMQQYFG